jgi:large subunit ribosomal protein L9
MEVILLESVQKLGELGDKVTVKAGYGRNFLVPQKKAVPATAENLQQFENRRADLEAAAGDKLSVARKRAKEVEELAITITTKAGEEGKLFGSITVRDVANACEAAGVELEKSEVRLPEGPIRELGEFEINIHLHPEVDAVLKLAVVAET